MNLSEFLGRFRGRPTRVARWYICKPNIPNFGHFWKAWEWELLVHFMAIWYVLCMVICYIILPFGNFRSFGTFFTFWFVARKKSGRPETTSAENDRSKCWQDWQQKKRRKWSHEQLKDTATRLFSQRPWQIQDWAKYLVSIESLSSYWTIKRGLTSRPLKWFILTDRAQLTIINSSIWDAKCTKEIFFGPKSIVCR
jgi:hypothetical protein